MSDIDTVAVNSLKALDPNRPIREADMAARLSMFALPPKADIRRGPSDVRFVPIASLRTAEHCAIRSRRQRA